MASRDQRARLLALTRAAYGASEGVDLDWPNEEKQGDPGSPHPTEGEPAVDQRISQGPQVRRRSAARERTRRGSKWRMQVSARAVVGIAACLITVLMVVVARSVMSAQALEPAPSASGQQLPRDAGEDASRGDEAEGGAPAAPTAGGNATDEGTTREELPSGGSEATPTSPVSPAADLVVHVAGNVVAPGLVSLPPGSRVADALTGAGGATAEADLNALNLARLVVDGEQIYVPVPGETPTRGESGGATPPGGASPGTATSGGVSSHNGGAGLINLNTADESELDALPGVGPAIAARIVAWREEHGGFAEVEELTEVSGIGPATLERLRPLVTV